ncbi:MAG: hypothetical protein QXT89_00025 [Candidatus Micrarchaeaceae archaeon]
MDNFVANINLGKKLNAASRRRLVKKVSKYMRQEVARFAKAKESEIKIDQRLNEFLIKNAGSIRRIKVSVKRNGAFFMVSAEAKQGAKAGSMQPTAQTGKNEKHEAPPQKPK